MMKTSIAFARIFFTFLSIVFMTTYATAVSPGHELDRYTMMMGLIFGLGFAGFLIGFDSMIRKFNLRAFNSAMLGIFFGYLMGKALFVLFETIIDISGLTPEPATLRFLGIAIYLFACYLGVIMTVRAAEEITISLPFFKFTPRTENKKDILVDCSLLQDARIIDLANSGLVDNHLIIPRYIVRDLYSHLDGHDEMLKFKAKRSIDTLKKLEGMSQLNFRYNDADFPETPEPMDRLIKLARLLDTNILTADINRVQMSAIEGVRIINIHSLANALKPIMQTGEFIQVKIQRYGKENQQGVGYLEDGTMVVVNGGGDFIGESIKGQVLSVKHTSSGRMIFCNAFEDHAASRPKPPVTATLPSDAQVVGKK